ncbi:MAG: acyl-CoA desaturase [Myxococcota bacterium]
MKELKQELVAAGVFERREGATWAKLALLLGVTAALLVVHTQLPLWGTVLLLPVTAFFLSAAAMIGHEGGHRSFSKSAFRCELLYHVLFPLIGGLGAINWKDKHNVRHHGHPNIVGVDDDMELWPLAHIEEAHLAAGPARRWVQRHFQAWLWWPMTSLFSWSIKVDNVTVAIRHARRHGIDKAWLLDVGLQVLHYVLWLVIPSLVWGFWPAFGFYLGLFGLLSVMLALVFTTGHMGLPIRHDHQDPLVLQMETTRDLALPKWLSFFFMGLDYQIEHHLFPKIAHGHLPAAAVITRRWAEKRNLPYERLPYLAAVAAVTRYVGNAWRVPAVARGAV